MYVPRIPVANTFPEWVLCIPMQSVSQTTGLRCPGGSGPGALPRPRHLPGPAASVSGPQDTLAPAPCTGQHYLSAKSHSTAYTTSVVLSSAHRDPNTSSLLLQSLVPSHFKSLVFSFMCTSSKEFKGNLCVACEPY